MTRSPAARRPLLTLAASLLALVALGALAGCGSDDETETGGGTSSTTPDASADAGTDAGISGRDWLLGADGTSFPVPDGVEITLRIDGGEASGSGGCNRYTSTVEIDGADITFGTVASTMMACAEPEKSEAETTYTNALSQIETFEVDGGTLVLSGGDVTLTYTELAAVPDPSEEVLVGTWAIDSIRIGSGETAAISSAVAGTEPTMTFADDGTYTVMPACNTANGEWTLDGSSLTLSEGPTTLMACAEPEGADEQDSGILLLIPQVASVEVQRGGVADDEAGSMLSLLDAEGNLLLGLSRQS